MKKPKHESTVDWILCVIMFFCINNISYQWNYHKQ